MLYVLFIIGGLLIYFGIQRKVSDKKLSEMSGDDLMKTGCRGYIKWMMIIGGAALILIALVWKLLLG